MAIKSDREYRNFEMLERARQEGKEPSYLVEGYASTFDEYELMNFGDEIWRERIERNAFDEADLTDVVFLLDHTGRVYARTKNDTIKLSVDDHGFFSQTDLSKTASSREVYEDIEAGNYSQMSFAFTVAEDHYDVRDKDGVTTYTRIIDRIKKVYDISAVGFPANPNTDIGVATRAAFDGAIEKLRAERLEEEKRQQEKTRQEAIAKLKFLEVSHD